MKPVYALLALSLALPAMAQEVISPAQQENTYLVVCQPGSAVEKSLNEKDKQSAVALRQSFQSFLKNPEPTLEMLKDSALFGKGSEEGFLASIGLAIQFSATCGFAVLLEKDIGSRGCRDELGAKLSAAKAAALCKPLIAELERLNKEEKPEN